MALFKEKTKKEDDDKIKKLITLSNPKLFNFFVKLEAMKSGRSESDVIEELVCSNFLNKNNSQISYSVKTAIEDDDFSIQRICFDIFCYYSALPNRANDTLHPLINFLWNQELKYPTEISGSEDILYHLLDQLDSIIEYFESYYNKARPVQLFNKDGFAYIEKTDINTLKYLYDHISKDPKTVGNLKEFANVFIIISKYWGCGLANNEVISLKNWSIIYRLMGDICRLADWTHNANEVSEFLKIINNINESDNQNSFDPDFPILTKLVSIKFRTILTTEDAVILKADSTKDTKDFAFAREIIHGPSGGKTERPYILLFNEKDMDSISEIAKRVLIDYSDEFPFPSEAHVVPFLIAESYHDPRIRWYTM